MCAMLGLPQLQKTLNETTDLIHTRLLTTHRGLQITEKRVGIVHICIPVFISQIQKKINFNPSGLMFPTHKSVMLCF